MRFLTCQVGFSRTPNAVQHAGKKNWMRAPSKIFCAISFFPISPLVSSAALPAVYCCADVIRHPETYIHRYSPERYIPEPNPLYIYCLQPYPVALLLITELLTTKSCVSTNIVSAFSVLSPQVVEYGSAASRTLRGTATRQRRVQFQAPLDSGASTVAGTRSFAVARAGKKARELKGKVRFTLTYHLVKGFVAKIYRYIPSMN